MGVAMRNTRKDSLHFPRKYWLIPVEFTLFSFCEFCCRIAIWKLFTWDLPFIRFPNYPPLCTPPSVCLPACLLSIQFIWKCRVLMTIKFAHRDVCQSVRRGSRSRKSLECVFGETFTESLSLIRWLSLPIWHAQHAWGEGSGEVEEGWGLFNVRFRSKVTVGVVEQTRIST